MNNRFYKTVFVVAAGLLAIGGSAGAVAWPKLNRPVLSAYPRASGQSRDAPAAEEAIASQTPPEPVIPATTQPDPSVRESVRRVDELIAAAWREANVEPLRPAAPMLVVRRLSLALCGTIPSLEEIRSLEKLPGDQRIDAHLERQLTDRRFADYWAERLARAFVGTQDGPFIIYRRGRFVYWLSDELIQNRPYDELVREIISAEGLWTDRPATNFITAFGTEQGLQKIPLAARTTRAFLGLRIDCAQCHDHPFTEWKQQDFHGLAAFFGPTKNTLKGIEDKSGEYEMEERDGSKRVVEPRFPFNAEDEATDGRARERLARWVTAPENKYFGMAIANRVWTLLFGAGLVEPVDNLEADPPRLPNSLQILELLGEDLRKYGYDLKRLIRVIAATRAFRIDSGGDRDVTDEQETAFAAFPLSRLRSEQIAGSLIQVSSLRTVDADSNVLVRFARLINTGEFIKHYGDAGEEELNAHVGTIPQRLAMMNSKVPREHIQANPFTAAGRIATLCPNDESRVRIAYLICLTRPPTSEEEAHFVSRLNGLKANARAHAVEDMLWALVNSTEFSWNH